MAGLGVASFRYGTQADNAVELEVVTGAGEIVTCSREQNRELFDVVRCGLGQFGIITRAKIRLRRCKPNVRKYYLLYDDLGAFMQDAEKIMDPADDALPHPGVAHARRARSSSSASARAWSWAAGMQIFAYWMYPLFLTVEYDAGRGPGRRRRCSPGSSTTATCTPRSARSSSSATAWTRCSSSGIAAATGRWRIPGWRSSCPGTRRRSSSSWCWRTCRRRRSGRAATCCSGRRTPRASDVPLFMHPPGEYVMGWGILPAVPHEVPRPRPRPARHGERAVDRLRRQALPLGLHHLRHRREVGRALRRQVARWCKAAKKRFDPDGILGPGFIQYG